VKLYLDEIPAEASYVRTIPLHDIALVKIFRHFVGVEGNGAGGVMSIYTKKGADLYNSTPSSADQAIYHGYSIIKEFYAPDYFVNDVARSQVDHRITLQWLPGIASGPGSDRIPITFYNSDRAQKFRIVVQGMTRSGKLVCIDKIFDRSALKHPF
jgi:hypothetical protein